MLDVKETCDLLQRAHDALQNGDSITAKANAIAALENICTHMEDKRVAVVVHTYATPHVPKHPSADRALRDHFGQPYDNLSSEAQDALQDDLREVAKETDLPSFDAVRILSRRIGGADALVVYSNCLIAGARRRANPEPPLFVSGGNVRRGRNPSQDGA